MVSAGTLLLQELREAEEGWEVVAIVNDSGHYKPKSRSVRHVYRKLHQLGHDCLRICDGEYHRHS